MERSDSERIAIIETTVNRIDHSLNGNGQPGLVQKFEREITERYRLSDRLDAVCDDLSKHVSSHDEKKEDWKWVVALLLAIVSAAAAWLK